MSTNQAWILLVEDDFKLASLVKEYLESNHFRVEVESNGERAVARILRDQPDLVILDLMLPGLDGLSVCRRVREHFSNPILVLTARVDEVDEIVGLEVGADDYMAKPVRPRLLLARVHTLLRRHDRQREAQSNDGPLPENPSGVCRTDRLVVDLSRREVTLDGALIDLSTAEFDLLTYFAQRPGVVLTREQISRDLRGIEWDGLDRTIDIRVARLRRKLGDDGKAPQLIKSVRGTGYLLVTDG